MKLYKIGDDRAYTEIDDCTTIDIIDITDITDKTEEDTNEVK